MKIYHDGLRTMKLRLLKIDGHSNMAVVLWAEQSVISSPSLRFAVLLGVKAAL